MNVKDLSREELVELKESYMTQLANEGTFAEVFGVDYHEPSWGDLANADKLVPDDVVFRQYEGIEFVPEDFCINRMAVGDGSRQELPWSYFKHSE